MQDDMEQFFQIVSNFSATGDGIVEELLSIAEDVVWNVSAPVDGEFVVNVFAVIGDVATASLSEDDETTYEMPGGMEFRVKAPSNHRLETGFVLGPFTVPPLVQHENVSVQVISWATNLFGMEDISDTVLTLSVRKDHRNVALTHLAEPLLFTLAADETMTPSRKDKGWRSCVCWNATSGVWSDSGLQLARSNLTQVGMLMWCRLFDCLKSLRLRELRVCLDAYGDLRTTHLRQV